MTYDRDRIVALLRDLIEKGRLPPDRRPAGALPPGSQLPGVDALAETYGVHRNTAHQALVTLRTAGLIHTRTGRFATVANPSPAYVITSDAYTQAAAGTPQLTAWEDQIVKLGEQPRTVHYLGRRDIGIDLGLDGRGTTVAELAGLTEGTRFIYLAGDGHSTPIGPSGEPDTMMERVVQIYDGWFSPELAEQAPQLLEPRAGDIWEGGAFSLIHRVTGAEPVVSRRIITNRVTIGNEDARFHVPPLERITAEVEIVVDRLTGDLLAVVWYRRLFGVAQWDLS